MFNCTEYNLSKTDIHNSKSIFGYRAISGSNKNHFIDSEVFQVHTGVRVPLKADHVTFDTKLNGAEWIELKHGLS